MSLSEEAITRIAELGKLAEKSEVLEIEGGVYYVTRSGSLQRIIQDDKRAPTTISFSTLSGLVDYICENKDGWKLADLQIIIESPVKVAVVRSVRLDCEMRRDVLARAESFGCEFVFGKPKGGPHDPWYALIDFIIAIQSQFVQDEQTEKIIGWLGHLANEKVVEKKDDGFSQHIQVKTGITTKTSVKIENPVTLRPYRTFRELAQPEGKFVLRLDEAKDGGILVALFAADGGAWELDAMQLARRYVGDMMRNAIGAASGIPILC